VLNLPRHKALAEMATHESGASLSAILAEGAAGTEAAYT
jgi:hypothetical protein